MIRYARRKKKKDLFVLWLGLSMMSFGIAGATLRGVSAVRGVPMLIDSEMSTISVDFVVGEAPVSAEELIVAAGGDFDGEATEDAEPVFGPIEHTERFPFEGARALPLEAPEPIVDDFSPAEPELTEAPDLAPHPLVERPLPEPPAELTPPEPEPEVVKPMEEPKAQPVPEVEKEIKVEAKPPPPPKKKVVKAAPKKTRPKKTTPPKPRAAPRAVAANPNVAVQAPKVVYKAPLRFPAQAKRRGWGGKILLEARIGTSGRVESVRVVKGSGHRVLDAEAIATVKASRFEPARNAYGKALSHTIRVPLDFGYAKSR